MSLCISLYDFFIENIDKHYEDAAIFEEDRCYTFKQLYNEIENVANYFEQCGIKKNDCIALCMQKGFLYIACIFAASKMGVAYIPLDNTMPKQRIEFIINTAMPKMIFVQGEEQFGSIAAVNILKKTPNLFPAEKYNESNLESVAYIIFTSGSTGTPKGVIIDNNGLQNFILWVKDYFSHLKGKIFLNLASFSFDQSVLDFVFLSSLKCPIVVTNNLINPMALLNTIEQYKVQAVSTVPSSFNFFISGNKLAKRFDISSLETLILGGSAFSVQLKKAIFAFNKNIELYNIYGPTEATVYCMIRKVFPDEDYNAELVPLGQPILNMSALLYDEERGVLPDAEAEGELVILGPQVMVAYFADPERTKAATVLAKMPQPNERVYRTGDIVMRKASGEYHFLSRNDDQIKVSGYRVNLTEIESACLSQNGICEAAAVAYPDDLKGHRIFVFIGTDENVNSAQLQNAIQSLLPAYMLPEKFFYKQTLPKSVAGKVNKKALLEECRHAM